MARIEIRIDDDLAAAFAEHHPSRGDRSAILRNAILLSVRAKSGDDAKRAAKLELPPPESLMRKSPKGRRRSLRSGETVPVSVRLTPEQYTGIEDLAHKREMATSAYIRALVDGHLERDPQWPKEDRTALTLAMTQLRKAGINLNQLTLISRAALKDGKRPPVPQSELANVLKAVQGLKAAFLKVLTSRDSYWQMKGHRDA